MSFAGGEFSVDVATEADGNEDSLGELLALGALVDVEGEETRTVCRISFTIGRSLADNLAFEFRSIREFARRATVEAVEDTLDR